MGKHRGKPDPNEPAERPGAYKEGEPLERTVAMFDGSLGSAVIGAADKRLRGQVPYDQEPGSKGPVDSRGVRNDPQARRNSDR